MNQVVGRGHLVTQSVREMKSTIVVVIFVVWSFAGSGARGQRYTRRKKEGEKYADVNIEEVCDDRYVAKSEMCSTKMGKQAVEHATAA